ARNHSATHLLQKALRDNLGEHVHQTGSFVNEERMRFDFSHFTALTQEELVKVENQVNDYILADMPINCTEMPIEEAKSLGAMAFFGDKYGDIVRVVKMGDCSMEFCGGTHCSSTGEIGFVKILSETGIAAGMRRIEMITGKQTLAYYQQQEKTINEMASSLKTLPGEISKKVAKIVAELKEKNKEIEKLKAQLAQNSSGDLLQDLQEINGLKMLAVYTKSIDNMSDLRTMMDNLRQDAALDILILAAKNDEKVFLAANVSAQAQAKGFHAGNIIKEVAAVCGGSGGGKADMAQAGGKDISKIGEAIDKAWEILQGK
ncbi:MAG: DHHA1 domain-containing protein, partial [Clostridiales bacterium]